MAAIPAIPSNAANVGALDFASLTSAAVWVPLGAATWQEVIAPDWAHTAVIRVLNSADASTSAGYSCYIATQTVNGDGGALDAADGVAILTDGINPVQEFHLSKRFGTENVPSLFIAVTDTAASVHITWEGRAPK